MRKIADIAAYLFIFSVVILSAVSILGVWNFFADDVISKSFQSIGLLALVAIIVIIADHFIDKRPGAPVTPISVPVPGSLEVVPPIVVQESNGIFKGLRTITLSTLVLSVALLALLGIMAIWEVLSGEVLSKSISSIAIGAFSSLIIVMTCLERENNPILYRKKISGGMIILAFILVWIFVAVIFS